MSPLEKGLNVFLAGLVGIALATTLVKPGAQTPAVLNSAGGALGTSLQAAQGNPGS
jgi:hypothetical protein